jgi:hypothetical protein
MATKKDPATRALIEMGKKLGRAEAALKSARRGHSSSCAVEMDPEGYTPCNCGATLANVAIDKALSELDD